MASRSAPSDHGTAVTMATPEQRRRIRESARRNRYTMQTWIYALNVRAHPSELRLVAELLAEAKRMLSKKPMQS
jgi:hypothetical protein